MMINLAHPADADDYNQQSVKRLVRTLTLSQGDFTLILAHCNYQALQAYVVEQLQLSSAVSITSITLDAVEQTLFTATQRMLQQQDAHPKALMVFGLNRLKNLDQVLKATNQVRDEFRKQFSFPLVLWVNNDVLRQLIRLAPDFQSWATTMDFQLATSQLFSTLEQRARMLFNHLLQAGSAPLVPNSRIFGLRYRRELNSAIQDLKYRQEPLSAELSATLAFVEGREAFAEADDQRSLDQAFGLYQRAIDCYQASLDFWDTSQHLEQRGCVLYHLGIAWTARGERYRSEHEACYRTALTCFWRCIDTFAQMERPDYEARFINALCFALQRLNQRPDQHTPQWDELEQWAKRSLLLQQHYNDRFRMARAYGFLSEVAIAREQWPDAKRLAERAQAILETELENPEASMASGMLVNLKWERSFHQGWYLLALARASHELSDTQAAIQHLHKAKQETEVDYDPELYIRILNQLRYLYFEQKDYRTAFQLRQQRRAIEYQYNFRAFVGASHLQPKHNIANPALSPRLSRLLTEQSVPSDFQTSGRQEDIENLIGRIASTNHRLTVIHGQSGVGKSSILEAGLLPSLQYNPIGTRHVMPIFQQVYAEWDRGLAQALMNSLKQFDGRRSRQSAGRSIPALPERRPLPLLPSSEHRTKLRSLAQMPGQIANTPSASTPNAGTLNANPPDTIQANALKPDSSNAGTAVGTAASNEVIKEILAQLKWNSRHDIVTVLLFDQFEEFFFACKGKGDRLRFYQFLKDCLNISFVNVIISLREDYLHSLLEMTRCLDLDVINNDILSNQILYHIGNLSQHRARKVIRTLSAKTPFQLDDALIERLVTDLAEKSGDVSPIELQIVGSQMQTEQITTLQDYEARGPMVKLVQRYLDEALTNCGPEHQQMAKNLLYALTDEQQMRPLKTLVELTDDSGADPPQVELILKILVGAGMVVEFPEASNRYYQLVHDYLVPVIREAQHPALLASLTWTKSRLNQALKQEAKERLRAEVAEIKALNALSKALLLSHDHLNALMKGVEAARKLITVQHTHAPMANQDGMDDTLTQIEHDTVNRLRHTLSQVKEVNRLEGHDAKTFGVAFHPNGQSIASGSADHTVRIWEIDGKEIAICEGHRDQVFGVSFSPDGQFLASASADETIKLWRRQGGPAILTFSGHTDTVYKVVFHPNKPLLASASRDGTIRLWSMAGEQLHTFRRGIAVLNLTFSPDGETIVSAYSDGKLRIWQLDGTCVQEIKAHDRTIYGINYGADGQALISASEDGTLKLWPKSWALGSLSHNTHGKVIYRVGTSLLCTCLSPDGQLLAFATNDGAVRLCNLKGQIIQTFQGHQGRVYGVCFSPDGRLLASTGDDRTVRLWNLDGIGLHVAQGHDGRIISAAFGADDQLATAGEDHTVKLWRLDGTLLKTFHGHGDLVRQVCFSPDSHHLASASNDGTVKVWHVDGGLIQTVSHHYGGVRDVCFSPDGGSIISAGNDRIVRLWPLSQSSSPTVLPLEFHGARARVLSVAMRPDARLIAGASGRAIIFWEVNAEPAGVQHHIPHAHNARVLSVCFSPDGEVLASAGADKVVKLWRCDGTVLRTLRGHQATVKGIYFSADGRYLLSYGSDRTVRVWQRDGRLVKTLRGHAGTICGVTWQPHHQRILSVGESSVVKGWRLEDLDMLPSLETTDDSNVHHEAHTVATQAEERDQPCIEFVLDAQESILLSDDPTTNLQQLVGQGCQWLQGYLTYNPCLSESDRSCCAELSSMESSDRIEPG